MSDQITSHKVNGLNESLEVLANGEPGSGGAYHQYEIRYGEPISSWTIHFQDGPIKECGVNGVSNEALLAIVEHRLACFQSGQYTCRENAIALTKIQEAMHWLHHRTRERVARGIEGTMNK